jgi:diguanylate cyclase (GGDEF)-like protein
MREIDSLARVGGEEFLALMPGATLDTARPVAERLRSSLDATPLALDGASVSLSVSIGIAQWTDAYEDASRLLVRADSALYEAKQQGRNCVVVASADGRPRTEEEAAAYD